MERIAPLAKILAEANGIDWEKLSGTGDGGMIVEQDILNYLSRVMSGEEDPPETPVDAPPPDWTGEDLPGGGMFDANMLKGAGVEEDIATFVSQTRPAAPSAQDTSAQASSTEVTSASIPATPPTRLDDEDFELDDEPARAPTPAAPSHTEVAAPVTPKPAPAPAAPAAGLGSLLSRLYHKDTPATPEPAAEPVVVPPVTPEPSPAEAPRIEVSAPTIAAAPEAAQPVPAQARAALDTPVTPEPVAAPVVEAREPEMPAVAAPVESTPEPVQPAPVAVPVSAPATQPQHTQPHATQPQGDAVWFGTYLRRQVNVQPASSLVAQLTEALERDVTLTQLVARAAQRHAGTLGVSGVALHDHGRNEALGLPGGAFREYASNLNSAYDGTPELLIVDAAHYGLDDLHYPHTATLSVGREANGQATLSFNGNADTGKAAQFLSLIAETLEKPIVLVL